MFHEMEREGEGERERKREREGEGNKKGKVKRRKGKKMNEGQLEKEHFCKCGRQLLRDFIPTFFTYRVSLTFDCWHTLI